MTAAGTFLFIYFAFMIFILYVFIFGNNKCHRSSFIGSIYRFVSISLPGNCNRWFRKLFGLKDENNDKETCMGTGGPCRFFIIIFFAILYIFLVAVYMINVYPVLDTIYSNVFLQKIYTIVIVFTPWGIVVLLQYIDPGEVNEFNVESYLAIYPHDNVIYTPKMCSTLNIPVVPRSRYCNYTHRRIAKYDHYCPWVLASIGERTHRWFLLFLASCMTGCMYLLNGFVYMFINKFAPFINRIKWSPSSLRNLVITVILCLRLDKWSFGTMILLAVVIITLLFFIIQQMYYISQNKTQIELDKYEVEAERRKKEGDKSPIINIYDKGIIGNWAEFLFPPKVKTHEQWKKPGEKEEKPRRETPKLFRRK